MKAFIKAVTVPIAFILLFSAPVMAANNTYEDTNEYSGETLATPENTVTDNNSSFVRDETAESLQLAVIGIDLAEIKRLITEENANVNYQDNDGYTALMFAATQADREIVEFLLKHGADSSLKNSKGQTAENIAESFGFTEIASIIAGKAVPASPKQPAVSKAPAPTPSQKGISISYFSIPKNELKKLGRYSKDCLTLFNTDIGYLNGLCRKGKPYSEMYPYLAIMVEHATDLAEDYPPARNKLRDILALFRSSIKNSVFHYYGTKGALEMRAWSTDLSKEGPEDCTLMELSMKTYTSKVFSPHYGSIYVITTGGRQIQAMSDSDLLEEPAWGWVNENGGMDKYHLPQTILPKSEATFQVLFPEKFDRSDVAKVIYLLDDYMLEIPIWENL